MNIDDGDDPKVRRKSLKMEMWAYYWRFKVARERARLARLAGQLGQVRDEVDSGNYDAQEIAGRLRRYQTRRNAMQLKREDLQGAPHLPLPVVLPQCRLRDVTFVDGRAAWFPTHTRRCILYR
jgi:hypothetical protein